MAIIPVTVAIMAPMLVMVTAIVVATIMVAILLVTAILTMIMVTVPVSSPDLYQRSGLESRGFVAAATEHQRADHQASDNAFHDRNL
ncbi:hypothetical protein [Onishia niordana]|uniref:hypothetical protein n=1 Tax=Onishia niordana TaxID=2508711 RepID=UPI001446ED52|nr:hypothetical protein [Halomonas niordiana]